MKSYLAIALSLCSGVLLSVDCPFPSAGGSVPGSSDKVIVDMPGNYTLGDNVTFNSLNVNVGGCNFDLGNFELKVIKSSESVLCKPENEQPIVFNGGVFDLSGVGYIVPCNNVTNPGIVTFDNGCIITNAARFYATKNNCVTGAIVRLAGGSKVYAGYLAVHNGTGTDNILDICDGGKVYVTGNLYADVNGTVNTYGGHILNVIGNGSLLEYKSESDVQWGFKQGCNTLRVSDGANVEFATTKKFMLGGSGSNGCVTNNALVVERSATASIPKIASNTDCNRIFVGDDATLTVDNLQLSSSCNEVIVSNATFSCANAFCLGDNDNSSHNIFRIIGSDITKDSVSLPFMGDWLISGHHHKISIENGAKWRKGSANSFFTNAHHCVFSVKDMGTQFGDLDYAFYLGTNNKKSTAVCADNTVEISDGSIFNAKRFMLMGLRNKLVISNATLNVSQKNDNVAIRIGYQDGELVAANCVLCLKGTTPKINVDVGSTTNSCWVQNNSAIRFEIPKEGYARNHVPVSLGGKFQFDSGCRFEIDCDDFARAGGGTLTLIETGYNMTQDTRNALLAGVTGLPEGSSIKISDRSVKLHCPRGLVISIR